MAKRPEHRITFPSPPITMQPDQIADRQFREQLLKAVKPTRMRLNLMSALATGWLPWGVKFWSEGEAPEITLCGRQYILCCGHALGEKVAQEFVSAGLLAAGERDKFDRPTLVITEVGRAWLNAGWR